MFNANFDTKTTRRMYEERLKEAAMERRAHQVMARKAEKENKVLPNLGNALITLGYKLKTPSPTA